MQEPSEADLAKDLSISIEDDSSQEAELSPDFKEHCENDLRKPVISKFDHNNMLAITIEAKSILEHSVEKPDLFDWMYLYFGPQRDNYSIYNLYPTSVYRMNVTSGSSISAEIDQIKYFGELGEQVINFELKNI